MMEKAAAVLTSGPPLVGMTSNACRRETRTPPVFQVTWAMVPLGYGLFGEKPTGIGSHVVVLLNDGHALRDAAAWADIYGAEITPAGHA